MLLVNGDQPPRNESTEIRQLHSELVMMKDKLVTLINRLEAVTRSLTATSATVATDNDTFPSNSE